ncbi:trypsin-like serine protease [Phaeobacter inhibens]|uniref:trypsin-like serine peptidase n=1 Tax=Phaeobacter inhibens TaxID=221822 RepID=UPI0021A58CF5|nr:trypsin-like serine protease [Phaeobacter inhibens]UWR63993.1 trypsin-like serine protease [Phaeobacter inhibens]UWR75712.1 trypsin-like serine protease [Phaeobacter inhibens]UWR99586.1 trypsin-like serine protease [Phaeobacter inhibens]
MRLCALVLTVVTAFYATVAVAQEAGLRRLTDRDDLLGWEAVGRLELNGQGFCTGTLIAPDLVLTAAHCVYGQGHTPRPADQITFRAGLRDGVAIAERRALQIAAHPGFRPGGRLDLENIRHDVALIRLAAPVTSGSANAFALHSGQDYGSDISVTSYGMGRAEALSRQRHCNLMAERADVMMIDCNVTFGSSGAPVFSQVGGRGRILALISGGGLYGGKQVAFGMKLPQRVAELKAQLRRNPVAAPDRRIKRIRVGSGTSAGGAKFVRPGG